MSFASASAVRFCLFCLLVVVACHPVDDGEEIFGCEVDCPPGALRSGRFLSDDAPSIAAYDYGVVVRTAGDRLTWLDATFRIFDTLSFESKPGTGDGRTNDVSVDPAGNTYLTYTSYDDFNAYPSLTITLDDERRVHWRADLESSAVDYHITGGHDIMLVTGEGFTVAGERVERDTVVALHREDGSLAWVKRGFERARFAAAADGSIIIAGSFSGTFGDLVATGRLDAFVAAYNPTTGTQRWINHISGGPDAEIYVDDIGVDRTGFVAIPIRWRRGTMTISGIELPWLGPDDSSAIALLGNRVLPLDDLPVSSLIIKGAIFVAGDKGFAELSLSGDVGWQTRVSGRGRHDCRVETVGDNRVVAAIYASHDAGDPITTLDDVTIEGAGLLLADLVAWYY